MHMNELLRPPSLPGTTRAAEGMPRRRFTVAEIESMVAKGIIAEDERIELVGGEVVPMSPKGARHEILRTELAFHLTKRAPSGVKVAAEAQFNLTDDTYVVADILVYPATIKVPYVRGPSALLVVEIADSSLEYDLNAKASIYAAHDVREYWVINAKTLITRIHRMPSASGYSDTLERTSEVQLTPQLAPEFAVRLNDLDLG
jgi:Uma2 family endonuclease